METATPAQCVLACIGDSNTYGYEPHELLGGRYPHAVRWTGRLELGGRRVHNLGQNGLSVPVGRAAADWANLLDSLGPLDRVTVMLGTNDLLGGADPEAVAERMDRFLAHLSRWPVLLLAPPHLKPGLWVPAWETVERSRRLGPLYRAAAEEHGCAFADAGTWAVETAFDGVHFTSQGHRVFARHMAQTLDNL